MIDVPLKSKINKHSQRLKSKKLLSASSSPATFGSTVLDSSLPTVKKALYDSCKMLAPNGSFMAMIPRSKLGSSLLSCSDLLLLYCAVLFVCLVIYKLEIISEWYLKKKLAVRVEDSELATQDGNNNDEPKKYETIRLLFEPRGQGNSGSHYFEHGF